MDLVNFQVGAKTVSLPILDILLTEQFNNDLTEVPNHNPNFIGVREFMGIPVPIFDLGLILNRQSTHTQNSALIETLHQLKYSSCQWVAGISDGHKTSHSQAQSTATQQPSGFLKWLEKFESDDEDLTTLLNRIRESLTQIQSDVTSADNQMLSNDKSTVSTRLERLYDSAIEQVEVGYKPIIVFTTVDGRQPHIGLLVDKVKDNINVDESDIKSLNTVTSVGFDLDSETKAMLKGLIQLEQKHSLIIETKNLFCESLE